jgi:hypothetical protein
MLPCQRQRIPEGGENQVALDAIIVRVEYLLMA